MRYILVGIFLLVSLSLSAQINTLRHRFYPHVNDTLVLDTMPIVPSSIVVRQNGHLTRDYILNWQRSVLVFPSPADSVEVIYRIFPFKILLTGDTVKPGLLPRYSEVEPVENQQSEYSSRGLNTSGRISRGIFFGSKQDPSLSSDFSLNLSGQLDRDVSIEAVIASNSLNNSNIDGTYSLQDFDKALIKVSFPKAQLRMGDLHVKNSDTGFFLRYQRAVKGADYFYSDSASVIRGGIGLRKGRFNRMSFMGQEGNQGPYRLRSADGKEFIVVISGSEKVYIDGQLKARGPDRDYIIDYNRGEITFTPNCLITKDSRIVVEFEYWDFDFVSYSMWGDYRRNFSKGYVYTDFFQQRDNPSSPSVALSPQQLQLLYSIGDSTDKAVWLVADSLPVTDTATRVLYCRKDTVINGRSYKIFVYSHNSYCRWKVSFLYVGAGKGDYIIDASGINGRVFRWVGPGRGDYIAGRKLPVPKSRSVFITGGKLFTGQKAGFTYEIARGYTDKNLFSPFDDRDNSVYNLRLGLGGNIKLQGFKADTIAVNYTLLSKDFPQFDRFLPVEFRRDWNLQFSDLPTFHFFNLSNNLKTFTHWNISTGLNLLLSPGHYTGYKTDWSFVRDTGKIQTNSWVSYNYSRQGGYSAAFFRTSQQWAYHSRRMTFIFSGQAEHNLIRSDSVMPGSFAFWDLLSGVQVGDSTSSYWMMSVRNRRDFLPLQGQMKSAANAWTLQSRWNIKRKKFSNLFTASYRLLIDTSLHRNILLLDRSMFNVAPGLNLSFIQQLMNGVMPVTEYYFVKVPAGQGQYAWIDFNKDGVDQLNEFQLTTFTEQAEYIRVVLPANRYFPVTISMSTFNFSFSPRFIKNGMWRKFFSCFTNDFSLSLNSKNHTQLFAWDYADTSTVFFDYVMLDNLQIKVSDKIKANVLLSEKVNKDITLGGMRFYALRQKIAGFKYDLTNKGAVKLTLADKHISSSNQLFLSENYFVKIQSAELSYLLSDAKGMVEVSASSAWARQINTDAFLRSFSLKFNINRLLLRNLRVNFISSVIYNYSGNNATPQVEYQIFRGYASGLNLDNMLNLSFRLNKTFTISLDYQFRLVRKVPVHNFGFRVTGWF